MTAAALGSASRNPCWPLDLPARATVDRGDPRGENGACLPRARPGPQITWENNTWSVILPMDDGRVLDASWQPGVTYVIRIREAGTGQPWSFGFETPLPGCTLVDLKPDTDYELQVRARNDAGEGEPAFCRIRTNRTGQASNVIPFPKR